MTKLPKSKIIFLAIFFFGLFGLAKISQAATTYYVCDTGSTCGSGWSTGNDSNACTAKSAPCKTINGGISKATAGDTIIVGNGTYKTSAAMVVNITKSGTSATARYTLKAENKWGAILSKDGSSYKYGIIFDSGSSHWVIDGFKFTDIDRAVHAVNNASAGAHDIIVKNCYFANIYNVPIYRGGGAGAIDFIIDSNIFDNSGIPPPYDNDGIYLSHDQPNSYNTIINNIFIDEFGQSGSIANWAIMIDGAPNYTYIVNNTFYNTSIPTYATATGGILWNPWAKNCVIQNNIFYNMRTSAIRIYTPSGGSCGAGNRIVNNLVYGAANLYTLTYPQDSGLDCSSYWTMANNIIGSNPNFVNVPTHDFHLQSNSPAINAGSATNAPAYDFDNNSRPQGSGYDIGAFEYISPSDTTPPSPPTGVVIQ